MADDAEFDPDDLQAIKEGLRGSVKKGSARDLQARRALARMLRSSPDRGLLFILADAVDPDGEGALRLSLKRRKRGRRPKVNDRHVAAYVYQRKQAGVKQEAAVKDAMDEFRCVRSTVTDAWRKWRPHIESNPKPFARI